MVSKDILESVTRDLQAEQTSLHDQLAELGYADVGDTGLTYDTNFADTSQVTAERSEAAAVAGTLREHLADVEHALQKLSAGTYGVCENCNAAIDDSRLEAIPAGRLCLNCATERR